MSTEQIIIGIVIMVLGIFFFFNNKRIGRGACKLYKKFYTEKNLIIMFKIIGIFLFVMGLVLVFVE